MKIAPLMAAFAARRASRPDLETLLVHTGQHYDAAMSDSFFEDLQIPPPDINLGVGSGSHAEQTAKVMVAFEAVCLEHKPDWVIVVGDVNSTMACAITAQKLKIRVAHVEAGLRSRDWSMPEEINRLCTDAISNLLFTTDRLAGDNLTHEGVPDERISFVGNTMIDTLVRHKARALAMPLPDGLGAGCYAVLTLHRPSNVNNAGSLRGILEAMFKISDCLPVVFPAHPRTLKAFQEFFLWDEVTAHPNLRLVEPLGYLAFLGLVARSRMVLTDSGGIQEETTFLGIQCLTMRENTERPITCTMGTNVLVGTSPRNILDAAMAVINGPSRPFAVPEKWDGHAADRIVDVIATRT